MTEGLLMQEPVELSLRDFEFVRLLDSEGKTLLNLDRLENPSGHYVLTISDAEDSELLQMHTLDSPAGPRSPLAGYRLILERDDGTRLLEISGERLRLFGRLEGA